MAELSMAVVQGSSASVSAMMFCGAPLRRTAESGCPYASITERWRSMPLNHKTGLTLLGKIFQ